MKNFKILAAVLLLAATLGCTEDPAKVAAKKADTESKAAIIAQLKDPDSAKFGEIVIIKADKGASVGCRAVNAKNSMGGYTGNKQVALVEKGGHWEVVSFLDVAEVFCLSTLKEMF